jgi:murein DD-endopeptidase MepM/ murein hydrolase activator NlpD
MLGFGERVMGPESLVTLAHMHRTLDAKDIVEIERIEALRIWVHDLFDEHALRYNQRYDGQQEALRDSRLALKEQVESARSALSTDLTQQLRAVDVRAATANETLERLLESNIGSLAVLMSSRFDNATIALEKADIANEKRFDAVNEFRRTLSDQAATFALAATVNAKFDQLTEQFKQFQLQALENQRLMDARLSAAQQATDRATSQNGDRISNVEGKVYIGGAGVVVLLTVIQIAINFLQHVK